MLGGRRNWGSGLSVELRLPIILDSFLVLLLCSIIYYSLGSIIGRWSNTTTTTELAGPSDRSPHQSVGSENVSLWWAKV